MATGLSATDNRRSPLNGVRPVSRTLRSLDDHPGKRAAPPATIEQVSNIALRVTADAARRLRAGHPWLFDGSVTHQSRSGEAGELAVAFDPERRFVAIGLFDPASPIRLRVLHHGRPATIDEHFFAGVVRAAAERRAVLVRRGTSTGIRFVHGENDHLPGIVVDRYTSPAGPDGDVAVLKVYSSVWLPHLALLTRVIGEVLGPANLVVRYARTVRPRPGDPSPGSALIGRAPAGPVRFSENGLTVEADVVHGQKTGYFLDQRDNRARVRGLCTGRRVLDVFACTGGFSLAAAAGGATAVHSVDLSPQALAGATRLFELNAERPAVAACEHTTTVGDAFAVLESLERQTESFDMVIVDPPSFANRQAHVPGGLAAYRRATRLALAVLRPGGLLVQSSCSSRIMAADFFAAVHAEAAGTGRPLRELERTGQPVDHPVGFAEGAYLKTLYARA